MSLTSPFALTGVPLFLRPVLKSIMKLSLLENWYGEWQKTLQMTASGFLAFILDKLALNYTISPAGEVAEIPKTGALVIVANHPLGTVEGIILSHYLLTKRPDLKVVTNDILLRFPEFQELFVGVDILSKTPRNKTALIALHGHLANQGALLIFPAGTVGDLNFNSGQVEDAKWQHTAAKLALKYNANCLPLHIEGRNSRQFYLSARIHKRLRTLLLPRAMIDSGKRPISIHLGKAFKLSDVGINKAQMATDYLRATCELTGARKGSEEVVRAQAQIPHFEPPASLDYLAEYLLFRQGTVAVYCLPFAELGCLKGYLLTEREITFRKVGEGSGQAMDFDQFDQCYQHIIAWDCSLNRLIGGYRACRVSDVIDDSQNTVLYSRSLFHYGDRFIRQFASAIEVGRSFVCAEYQGDPRALDYLWRGLGMFMLRNPDCHTFIGCVSISASYAPLVRELFRDTLLAGYRAESSLLGGISPGRPFKATQGNWSQKLVQQLSSVSAVNKLLGYSGLDVRVPVLIRHYLSLNGRFIDFTINEGFSNSLDGLIIVDLRNAPERYLKRYLGEEEKTLFIQRWRTQDAA